MAEAPEESIVPGLFPSVLLLCFAEPCVLADPTEVDEFDLHVFCPISVVRFVRACYSMTLVCRFFIASCFSFTPLKVLCECNSTSNRR